MYNLLDDTVGRFYFMPYVEIEMEGYGKVRGKSLEVYIERDGKQIDLTSEEIKQRLGNDKEKIIKFFSLFNCECNNEKIRFLLEKQKSEFNKKYGRSYELMDMGAENYIKESLGRDCCYM